VDFPILWGVLSFLLNFVPSIGFFFSLLPPALGRFPLLKVSDYAGRVFVHIANSMMYRQITGMQPPSTPVNASEYAASGFPW
jgi:hypothetical protein